MTSVGSNYRPITNVVFRVYVVTLRGVTPPLVRRELMTQIREYLCVYKYVSTCVCVYVRPCVDVPTCVLVSRLNPMFHDTRFTDTRRF